MRSLVPKVAKQKLSNDAADSGTVIAKVFSRRWSRYLQCRTGGGTKHGRHGINNLPRKHVR